MDQTEEVKEVAKTRPPLFFVLLVILLIGIFISGLKWIFTLGASDVGSTSFLVFDYAVGLTMIFLPCTLPLAFVIVPMVMGRSYQKGIGMALAFGLGVTITLSFYGALIGLLGQLLGIHQVETAKNILYAVAGFLAILFALGELGLIKFQSPTYGGGVPQFVLKQKDLLKALLLGLFLGNVGVGCPNPLFNAVIIPQIVATGSPFQGLVIMLVQALGRITPLFILAFLAILGINATSFLVKHKEKVTQVTAWTTLFVGGFLLTLGVFGHDWWTLSGIHSLGEKITQEGTITDLLGSKVQQFGHTHSAPVGGSSWLFGLPISLGTPVLIISWVFPMLWYLVKREKNLVSVPQEQQATERKYLGLLTWFFVSIFAIIITIVGFLLPHMFTAHWSEKATDRHDEEMNTVQNINATTSDFHSVLSSQSEIQASKPFVLKISLYDKKGLPITDLQLDHERILHVILVSEDLNEFKHVHPEDSKDFIVGTQANEFEVPLTVSKAGRYRVLIDGSRKGMGGVFDTVWLEVSGGKQLVAITKDLSRTRIFDGYEVTLGIDSDKIKAGHDSHLNYSIKKDGIAVFDTDEYLGADMHLVFAPADLSTMIHAHGMKEKTDSSIEAHETFSFPGLWKIYGQFQHKGKVVTTEFMVEVEQEINPMVQPQTHMDDHGH
ncbi:MAG: hypothetical protein A2860_03730 [Candidatus Levybacteria bacterium RIFCSPHIGHO2_01_FULL_37_33]|nr:MAG: hypothetical protein A2860_03730 [Candidatus Levybacteria bacterium RIFCSPHIGHO2_01_FULL_37_33]OGH17550.1 MAG: hypothetical protein A3C97_01930 [Candidatus Levybacteria bacterium RIFCSPHIGHO2_02_FULL_37_11]OGH30060.1 MAG: hypothetical protein A3F30_03610 [Candidatus Levybacteria bacterium RIFCSPHIGHO2_12_FULL_37_12]OGH32354.1 MAG: hypothetical protein A2953_01770 [Candidatus Levybacteria bacterium RIFCSPLOWO2_01_FULL_36_54]